MVKVDKHKVPVTLVDRHREYKDIINFFKGVFYGTDS